MADSYVRIDGVTYAVADPEAKRTPSDGYIDNLRQRRAFIDRTLGIEADALRAEAKAIDAAIKAYESAKPKTARKIGVAR